MNEDLEILKNNDRGYHPLVKFGTWRVAVASQCDKWIDGKVTYMERHMKTDEVFVLLKGQCALFIGDDRRRYDMEIGKVYNVKKAVWHNMALDGEGLVLIVENDDTCKENTEYCDF